MRARHVRTGEEAEVRFLDNEVFVVSNNEPSSLESWIPVTRFDLYVCFSCGDIQASVSGDGQCSKCEMLVGRANLKDLLCKHSSHTQTLGSH